MNKSSEKGNTSYEYEMLHSQTFMTGDLPIPLVGKQVIPPHIKLLLVSFPSGVHALINKEKKIHIEFTSLYDLNLLIEQGSLIPISIKNVTPFPEGIFRYKKIIKNKIIKLLSRIFTNKLSSLFL